MSANAITILIVWALALAIFFGFVVLLRYLEHRERMALIERGIDPDKGRGRRKRGLLRAGLITMMVGITLILGLYPIGYIPQLEFMTMNVPFHLGPWLLPGLIPLGVGLALTVSYYLEQGPLPSEKENEEKKIIDLEERRTRDTKEQ